MTPDGSDIRVLAGCGDGALPGDPVWSADGRRLLFESLSRPAMVDADGGGQRLLPFEPGPDGVFGRFSLSPDGRHFAYTRPTRDRDDADAEPEIWRASTDGHDDRQIGEGWSPRWSPDGRMIAYVGGGGVWLMRASTGRRVRMVVRGAVNEGSLDWSPNGRRILWSPIGSRTLWTARTDGRGSLGRLTTAPPLYKDGAVWSPDGRRVAFVTAHWRGDEVQYSIWTMSTRGIDRTRIYRSDWIDIDVARTPTLSWGPKPR